MIVIKEFPDKQFSNKEDMFKALRENKGDLVAQKKMATKFTDSLNSLPTNEKGTAIKAETIDVSSVSTLKMELGINTIGVMDSHRDVHIKGLWNRSIKQTKSLYLLQEHQMKFDKIITDDVKAIVKQMSWKELGAPYAGDTEVLVFSVSVNKSRNEFMFSQYAKGFVNNHSVGMRYVKLDLAINSESKWDAEEKEVWDKYIDDIANKEEAEDLGYFWAVTEAKIIEGSAVPIGSNVWTPTISTQAKESASGTSKKSDSSSGTHTNVDAFYKGLL